MNTITTTTTERVSVTAILADLILLQSRAGLPMPIDMHAMSNGCTGVKVSTLAEVEAWGEALTYTYAIHTATYEDRGPIYTGSTRRLGWYVSVTAAIDEMPTAPLDTETLAELEQIVTPSVKTEFEAHEYNVGGVGGDREVHVDEQPAGLTHIWDRSEGEWREYAIDARSTYWTPCRPDGTPEPGMVELSWAELLEQFGPVTSVEPVLEAAVTQ